MKAKILRLFVLFHTVCIPGFTIAQDCPCDFACHNWYLGNKSIRFSRSDNAATISNNPVALNGTTAVATDPTNGNLLFYTDGQNVYDVSHTVMQGGTGLNADASDNQSVVVAQIPGQPNQYYIITKDAAGDVFYTVVDMSLTGNSSGGAPPFGEVTAPVNNSIAGLTGQSEAMITIPHENGTDFWLITHQEGSNSYNVTLFTSAGPQPAVNVPSGLIQSAASFSYNAATGQIAVSPKETNRDVEIITFDNATGTFTANVAVPNTGVPSLVNGQAIFDVEWSVSGQYLYVSTPTDVLQFDLQNPGNAPISVLPNPVDQSFGLQMGPDSAIYHLYSSGGQIVMGKITDTDSVGTAVIYVEDAFPGNTFSSVQFSACAPSVNTEINVSFTSLGGCANSPISFFPTVSPTVDSLVWDFGDGTTANVWSPVHSYEQEGNYQVTVTAYLNGQTETFTSGVVVDPFDVQITLVQDTTACSCELPFPKHKNPPPPAPDNPCQMFTLAAEVQGSGNPTLQWYGPAGAMNQGPTLQPDSAGYYYVVATVGGCQTSAGVNIKEYQVQDQRANIWYFGQNAGIDFNPVFRDPDNPQPPQPISGPMNAPEGTSTISDRNGQVVFFTDGSTVWDRNGNAIATDIGGDPTAAQSALIIPVPGDETRYYIFTTQEVHGTGTYELRYTIFDLTLNNGEGGIVQPQGNLLFTKSTERITSNGNWLIAHEYGNNSFRAYQITADGIIGPVISGVGSDHAYTAAENGQGYMVIGPQNQIVVALNNTVEIFDFNPATGEVSNPRAVDMGVSPVYGIAFSPGGQKLYATVLGENKLYEFAYDSALATYTLLTTFDTPFQPGAIQNGPDGQTYVAMAGSSFLGTITPDERADTPSLFTPDGFALAPGTTSTLGLPNFIQTLGEPLEEPLLLATDGCLGTESEFSASGKDSNIDIFDWLFGDGQGALDGGPQITHTYAQPGVYRVSVRVHNKCGLDTVMHRDIEIHDVPPQPPMLADGELAVICDNQPKTLIGASDPTGLEFLWSTGETTPNISVTQPNRYSVVVTETATGCTNENTIDLVTPFQNLELGPDQVACQHSPVTINININPVQFPFQWFVDDVHDPSRDNNNSFIVDTSTPGPTTIRLRVTDPITMCSVSDELTYTINPTPEFTTQVTIPPDCGADNGTVNLDITHPVGRPMSYVISGPTVPVPNVATDVFVGTYPITQIGAGIYTFAVTDQVSGCANQQAVPVSNSNYTASADPDGICDPDIVLNVNLLTGFTNDITYNIINTTTGETYGPFQESPGAAPSVFSTNDPNAVRSGNAYIVQVIEDATGCEASTPTVNVTQGPEYPISFQTNDLCTTNSVSVDTGSPAATLFDWTASDAGSLADPASTVDNVVVNQGTWTLRVTASGSDFCPATASTIVTVSEPFEADFSNTNECADQVILTATPTGSVFLYRWNVNSSVQPGGSTLPVTSSGSYGVQIVNTQNGCLDDSEIRQVNVHGILTVALTTTLPCEGSPFTLTATPSRAATTFQWAFNGTTINNQTSSSLTDTRAGRYTVNVTAPVDCPASAELNILLAPGATVDIGNRTQICPEPENPDPNTRVAVLDAGPGFISYEWLDVTNGGSRPLGINTQTAEIDYPARIEVRVLNAFGCTGRDNTEVAVDCDPIIVGPNAFRPSSSLAANQGFKLFTFFISDDDFQVFIFNRWGEMVFQSNDRQFQWNGGYDNNPGKLLPPGTYAYVVRYRSSYNLDQGIREKRGGVVLIR